MKVLKGTSWVISLKRKFAYEHNAGLLLGEVFFATNKDGLESTTQKMPLDKLGENIRNLIREGFLYNLRCKGSADYRHFADYNYQLGLRRANAVKRYLESKVMDSRLIIDVVSQGESAAAQKRGGNRPSSLRMSKDRVVRITVSPKGIIAPVYIAARGYRIFSNSIERIELNNDGKIVVIPGSEEANVVETECRYNAGRRTGNQTACDPYLPTVIIEIDYRSVVINNRNEVIVNCTAVDQKTKRPLFYATAQTGIQDPVKIIQYRLSGSKVARTAFSEKNASAYEAMGYMREERYREDWELHTGRAMDLIEPLYNQLKGPYENITQRVAHILNYHS